MKSVRPLIYNVLCGHYTTSGMDDPAQCANDVLDMYCDEIVSEMCDDGSGGETIALATVYSLPLKKPE